MSFLGPRPPVTYFPKKLEEYTDFEKQRFEVKPGISGPAQFWYRKNHHWKKKNPNYYINKKIQQIKIAVKEKMIDSESSLILL